MQVWGMKMETQSLGLFYHPQTRVLGGQEKAELLTLCSGLPLLDLTDVLPATHNPSDGNWVPWWKDRL